MADTRLLLVISGPAGSGKTTLCDRLLEERADFRRVITCTSRPPRPREVNGEDYHFLSRTAFKEGIENDDFIEWAQVHNHFYGSRRHDLLSLAGAGFNLLLNIDVQGAASFRRHFRTAPLSQLMLASIFVAPASIDELKQRLRARGTEESEEIRRRLANAEGEIKRASEFDYTIKSASKAEDFAALSALVREIQTKLD
jgi:guanylate kinase